MPQQAEKHRSTDEQEKTLGVLVQKMQQLREVEMEWNFKYSYSLDKEHFSCEYNSVEEGD